MRTGLLIPFILLFSTLNAQTPIDTIWTNENDRTYIFVPYEVEFADPGSDEYVAVPKGQSVFLQAVTNNTQPSRIMIRYNNGSYNYGTVAYKKPLKQNEAIIDLRHSIDSTSIEMAEERYGTERGPSIDEQLIHRRVGVMLGDKKQYIRSLAIKSDKLILTVTNIMNDEGYYYVKLLFINDSKQDYDLDYVEFKYTDKVEDRSYKGVMNEKIVLPATKVAQKEIPAKSEGFLVYAIPKFNVSKSGELIITAREKNGSRTLLVAIPEDELIDSNNF